MPRPIHRAARMALLWLLVLCPVLGWTQTGSRKPWTRTIELKDRRDDGLTPVVAKITFAAYTMTEPTSPGNPITVVEDNGTQKVDPIRFPGLEEGWIKFKITKIDWSPSGTEYDGTADYKVVVRNAWVEMVPVLYALNKRGNAVNMRRRYITAPNVEFVKGDSLPPPIIYKVDKNGPITFTIGVKAVTPKTAEEKPFDFQFAFNIEALAVVEEVVIVDEAPAPVDTADDTPPPVDLGNPEIDEAIKQAIEREDVETLIDLIRENPSLQSAKDARELLGLSMTKELRNDGTYKIDIKFQRFPFAQPKKEDLSMGYFQEGGAIGENTIGARWQEGVLYVNPDFDSIEYKITALHRVSSQPRPSEIKLMRAKDFINFTYADTLENKVAFHINGGKGPYTLFIQRLSDGILFDQEGSIAVNGGTVVLTKDEISRAFRLREESDYQFFVIDADRSRKPGETNIHIVPPPAIPPVVWYALAGGSLLFLIGFLFYRREKRRKDDELARLLAERGGSDPRVKRKPRPELEQFWKETAIRELSLHKNFVREISTYLKERPHRKSDKPMIEGILLGTVLKFDFETEQYEVRLDRFRAIEPRALDYYEESGDTDTWAEIREVAQDHRDLVKIGWLQVVEGKPMRLSKLEQGFQDEQFSELFQLMLKIDLLPSGEKLCGFFTRTTSGKMNDVDDRLDEHLAENYWPHWDALEDAGYYESTGRGVAGEEGGGKIKVKIKGQPTA